ncbi:hypothetical protein [Sinomonas sp. P47F7]|uniref:hypothetical protein n=1 Tax=Sinomonas sp. P47F7 TaxID=3410987 RepID=UPI003BF4AEEC
MGKAARVKKARSEVREGTAALDSPDRYIEGFTIGQADALRGHCAEAVRSLGYRAWDRGSHIVVTGGPFRAPGATLGFTTIAREAARIPETGWGGLARDIVGHLISTALAAPPHLSRDDLREQLFPRFSAPGRIPPAQLAEDYSYARRVAGLPLLLAVRHSQASAFLADVHLSKAGGAEEAWEMAEANLFEAELGEPTAYQSDTGSAVILLESEHPRQAAWLAYPERLVERLGLEVGPSGLLFCVPAHRMLGFQDVDGLASVEDVHRMRDLVAILAEGEVAPLSSELFWWRPGQPIVAATAPRGRTTAVLDDSLAALLSGAEIPSPGRDFDTMDG